MKTNNNTFLWTMRGIRLATVVLMLLSLTKTDPVLAVDALPDLVVTGVNIVPATPESGSSFTVEVTVDNIGGDNYEIVPTPDEIYRDVYFDSAPPIDLNGCHSGSTYSDTDTTVIPSGGSVTRTVNINGGLDGGAHQLWVYVDVNCSVDESNENNNVYGPISFTVTNYFASQGYWSTAFNYNEGWRVEMHPRMVGDFDGDGKDDLVGIGYSNVFVVPASSSGNGFDTPRIWSSAYNYNEGWRVDQHPRMVGDFNGDGKDDLVGIGYSSVFVALANASGTGFLSPAIWSNAFNYNEGWRVSMHPRMVGDFNGDGKDDLIGIGYSSVFVALANASGNGFLPPTIWSNAFNYNEGWRVDLHPRIVGDVNGDGKDDLVGIGYSGVFVALAKSSGNGFLSPTIWSTELDYNDGWRVELHPRMLADANGDDSDDLVAFGTDGVYVVLANSTGDGFLPSQKWSSAFTYNEGWRVDMHPRMVGDFDGDGRSDLVGFGYSGVVIALSR